MGSPGLPVGTPAPACERTGHPEPVVVVPVRGGVPVAVRGAQVPEVVVPGAAAQDALGGRSGPRTGPKRTARKIAWRKRQVFGMLRMRDPGAHVPSHLFQVHSARRASGRAAPAGDCGTGARSLPAIAGNYARKDQAQERSRLRVSSKGAQSPALEIRRDFPPVRAPAVVVKTRSRPRPQIARSILAEVVQAIQVQIGEELARQVADGEAPPAFQRGEEIVARIVEVHRFLPVGIDDAFVYYGGRLEDSEGGSGGRGVLMAPRYRVTLTVEERSELKALTRAATKTTGKRFLYARALLLCDLRRAGRAGMDRGPGGRGAGRLGPHDRALETAVCGAGFGVRLGAQAAGAAAAESDLRRRVRGSRWSPWPGPQAPPWGRKRWTLRLLAEKVVELGWVERVSVMTVQRTLKKTNCSLIGRSIGGSRPGAAPHS